MRIDNKILLFFNLALFIFIFSACSNFGGIASNSKTYVSDYDFPALKVIPYNDPHFENKNPIKQEVNICTGKPDSSGFKCNY